MLFEVTNVEFARMHKKSSKLLAFATVTFNNTITIKGFKIVEGEDGPFVSVPQEKGSDDKYYPTVRFVKKSTLEAVQEAVLSYWEEDDDSPKKSKKSKKREDDDEEEEEETPKKKKRVKDDEEEEEEEGEEDEDIWGKKKKKR